jgi:hypothetical protein
MEVRRRIRHRTSDADRLGCRPVEPPGTLAKISGSASARNCRAVLPVHGARDSTGWHVSLRRTGQSWGEDAAPGRQLQSCCRQLVRSERVNRDRLVRVFRVCLTVAGLFATLATVASCAQTDADAHGELGVGRASGAVKPTQWGPWRRQGRRIEIGALVPYCGYGRQRPQVERVLRQEMRAGLALTMLVRFPARRRPGCSFMEVGVSRWVGLGTKERRLLDGSSSPPKLRLVY